MVSPWARGAFRARKELSTIDASLLLVSFCDDSGRQFVPCHAYQGQALCSELRIQ